MWVLLVEDSPQAQTVIYQQKVDVVFPPGPGRPDELDVRCAQRSDLALSLCKLDAKFACDDVPADINQLNAELRGELARKSIPTGPTGLYGISCDLEIPCAFKKPAVYHSGINLVRLFSFWRTIQRQKEGAWFKLAVCSRFAHLEVEVAPYCDRFITK